MARLAKLSRFPDGEHARTSSLQDTELSHITIFVSRRTMSLWQSYRNTSQRTRLLIGGGIMAYALFGLFVSDRAEKALGLVPTEEDKKRLKESLPRVKLVEREK